ncbi:hypothetical protein ABW19_dt0205494 [Dactylella cylindrospora]|nr:hypothetical protein ABW19_dt0205494 [Dactylella cylindrospora]
MFPARTVIARGGSRQWIKASSLSPLRQSRSFASPASVPFTYEVTDAAGTKVVSKDTGSPTASLAVVIKAGSRYQPIPGVSHALEHFAFKSTARRSALFLTREVELMGGVLETSLSRENVVYKARFLRGDLPYFTELLGDVVTKTMFKDYEFVEEVLPTIESEIKLAYSNPGFVALEAAHASAYHHGLGTEKFAVYKKYLNSGEVAKFAVQAFNKSNLAVVASGVPHADATKYTSEFFADVASGSPLKGSSTAYYGGESRVWSSAGSAVVIAFPGSAGGATFKPELSILSYILGGEPSIKWSAGNSLLGKVVGKFPGVTATSKNIAYSDTGLFYVSLAGPAPSVKSALPEVVSAIKGLSSVTADDVKKAIQNAKFDYYAAAEENALSMEAIGQSVIANGKIPQVEETVKALEGVTVDSVKKAASTILSGKASVGTVGDLHVLPYASDLGLNV